MQFKKVCKECGKAYETPSFWSRFCSVACRVKNWRKQQKQNTAPAGKKS